jgi:anti-anti-sigma regulatory factor
MFVETRKSGPSAVVRVQPEVASPEVIRELRRTLFRLVDDGVREVAVDLSRLTRLDGEAVCVFSAAASLLPPGGRFRLTGVNEEMKGFLKAIGSEQAFEIASDKIHDQ